MFNLKSVLVSCCLLLSFVYTLKAEAKSYQWENITQEQYIENLIDCHKVLKQYQWSKTIWPKSNSESKPSFDEIINYEELRQEVNKSVFKQKILNEYFNIKITSDLLQYDLNRMANHTKDAQSLKEIYSLFDNDPVTIAHCVSRSNLVETKLQNSYYWSSEIHLETKQLVKGELDFFKRHGFKELVLSAQQNRVTYKVYQESNPIEEKQESIIALTLDEYNHKIKQLQHNKLQENKTFFSYSEIFSESTDQITLNVLTWKKQKLEDWLSRKSHSKKTKLPIATDLFLEEVSTNLIFNEPIIASDTWVKNYRSPGERSSHTVVWTGTEMIVWGGEIGGIELNTGGRYNPVTDSWIEMNVNGAPIARTDHTAIWTGSEMVIWGGRYLFNGYNYLQSGGRYNPDTDTWSATSLSNAPSKRALHTTVWTGEEMIVWGGFNYSVSSYFNSGGRYNPVLDSWQSMTMNDAPSERENHSAIWTGSEMIIWGGNNIGWLENGGRYNPILDQWQAISWVNPPARRSHHTAIWTGDKMIIWGGSIQSTYFNTGGIYDPSNDSWQSISANNALEGRNRHSTIWTGNEMIVFGGRHLESFGNGARFNPNSNNWTPLPLNNAPSRRSSHSALWTGTEMIVWGGIADGSSNTGGRYHPDSNTWQTVATTDAPLGRSHHTAVWTGYEMIIWGGENLDSLEDGARYHPYSDSWIPMSSSNAPSMRSHHSSIWTGTDMIIWGGRIYDSGFMYLNTGARYQPLNDTWQTVSTNQAPVARYDHTSIWAGNEMIVWGGKGTNYEDTGGRYNPDTNTWLSTNIMDAPSGRKSHTSIWTGNEMIVWGGYSYDDSSTYYNDGSRYNPSNNSWQPISNVNAPSARDDHSVIWTSNEMIVWGGGPGGAGSMLNTGGKYNPSSDNWTLTSTSNAPSARLSHSAIWTGSDMIVWGGHYSNGYQDYFKSGGTYNPISNQWQTTSLINTPRERTNHSAIWTGKKMIIWGGIPGSASSSSTNTLGSYYPYAIDDLIFKDGFD